MKEVVLCVYIVFLPGAQLGGGGEGCATPAIHTLAKDMPRNRGATHFTLGLRPCIIPSFLLHIYLRPPLKIWAPMSSLAMLTLLYPCS